MRINYGEQIRIILENHYEWCKANGRDTKWYKEYKEQLKNGVVSSKILQRNA